MGLSKSKYAKWKKSAQAKKPTNSRALVGSAARTVRIGNKFYETRAVSAPARDVVQTDMRTDARSPGWVDLFPGERFLVLRPL